jgi:protein-S-isoprenylcysteine O-methyltransferase Ste14
MNEILEQEWHIRLSMAGVLLAMPLARLWWNRNLVRPDTISALRRNRWDSLWLVLGGNLILLGVLSYVVWFDQMSFARIPIPSWLRFGGLALAGAAFWWIRWADITLGENISFTVEVRPSQRLVREGPYRVVRHPIYLGALGFFAGLGLLSANLVCLLLMVGGWLLIMGPRIPREEALLLSWFGEEYRRYQEEVGRLWPQWSQLFPGRRAIPEDLGGTPRSRESRSGSWTVSAAHALDDSSHLSSPITACDSD